MAQIAQVIAGDPWKLASDLNALAVTNEIQIISKTYSSGKFIVNSDDTAPVGQTAVVLVGDPQTLVDQINAIISLPATIDEVSDTFSSAHYVVVYR